MTKVSSFLLTTLLPESYGSTLPYNKAVEAETRQANRSHSNLLRTREKEEEKNSEKRRLQYLQVAVFSPIARQEQIKRNFKSRKKKLSGYRILL